MSNETVKISWPTPFSNIRQELDLDKVYVHWGTNKEIRLSDVLERVLKEIENKPQ